MHEINSLTIMANAVSAVRMYHEDGLYATNQSNRPDDTNRLNDVCILSLSLVRMVYQPLGFVFHVYSHHSIFIMIANIVYIWNIIFLKFIREF